jgi:hypothetical protein
MPCPCRAMLILHCIDELCYDLAETLKQLWITYPIAKNVERSWRIWNVG